MTYTTKQKEILLDYLKSAENKHFTAGEVCEYFKDHGIGKSTVYRRLDKLVEEGVIKKYTVDPQSPACYEYVGEHSHVKHGECYHLKCKKCGKLIHLHCDEINTLMAHISKEHDFEIDNIRTVFYGLCAECR